jgi:hypothetical protein
MTPDAAIFYLADMPIMVSASKDSGSSNPGACATSWKALLEELHKEIKSSTPALNAQLVSLASIGKANAPGYRFAERTVFHDAG